MDTTAIINSKTKDGGDVELTVVKSGDDTANFTAKNWTVDNPPPAAPKVNEMKLYGARVTADHGTVMCKADILFGFDPEVTMVLNAPEGAGKSVTILVRGPFGIQISNDTYDLSDAGFDAVKNFIVNANYPVLA